MVKKNSFGEHSVVNAKASVMVYNDAEKRWLPSGSSAGLSKVSIYQHAGNNTFRVVGRKLQDMEVVVNCSIFKSLKYNQATPTFHQWRDNRQVYGLNFANKEDADNFAQAMYNALDKLNASAGSQTIQPPTSGQQAPDLQNVGGAGWTAVNGHDRSKTDSRTQSTIAPAVSSKDANTHRRNSSLDNTLSQALETSKPVMTSSADNSASQSNIASSPQAPPPAPPPPPPAPPLTLPKSAAPSTAPSSKTPTPPPAPPCPAPPLQSGPPAPPAPSVNSSGLAAALQSAQLRKVTKPPEVKDKEDSTTTVNYAAHAVTLGRSASCAGTSASGDMMSEMARRLRERRAKAEGISTDADDQSSASSCATKLDRSFSSVMNGSKAMNQSNGTDSPRVDRSKRFQSLTGQETFNATSSSILAIGPRSATGADLETWKQEILTEVRKEIQSVKQEIIEAIKIELTRR